MNRSCDSHRALHIHNQDHCWGRLIQTITFHDTWSVREREKIYYARIHNNEKAAPKLGIGEGRAPHEKGMPTTRRVWDTGPLAPCPGIVPSHFQSDSPFPVKPKMNTPKERKETKRWPNGNLSWVRVRVGQKFRALRPPRSLEGALSLRVNPPGLIATSNNSNLDAILVLSRLWVHAECICIVMCQVKRFCRIQNSSPVLTSSSSLVWPSNVAPFLTC